MFYNYRYSLNKGEKKQTPKVVEITTSINLTRVFFLSHLLRLYARRIEIQSFGNFHISYFEKRRFKHKTSDALKS